MARRVGVSNQRWSNVTRGLPLGMDLTRRLVTRFPGLTTDWLWFGRTDGMSVEMAEALGLVDVELAFGHHEDHTTAHSYAETREAVKSWRREQG
jgi:hypothetical protein